MNTYHIFPNPDRVIADAVHLIGIGAGSSPAGSMVTLPAQAGSFVFLAVAKGRFVLSGESLTTGVSQGAAVLLPDSPYSLLSETDSQYEYAVVSGTLMTALVSTTVKNGGHFFPNGAQILSCEIAKLNHAAALGVNVDGTMASSCAYTIMMQLYCKSAPAPAENYPALVSDAMAIMRENFAFLYGIDDLAQQLFVTKNHLIRQFTKAVGISPGKFLTTIRIEHAKLLFQSGETSLEAVAVASGFSGSNYFCKVFRREAGISPGEYLKSLPRLHPVHVRDSTYL